MTLEEFLSMDEEEEYEDVEIPRVHLTFRLRPLSAKDSNEIAMETYQEMKKKYRNISTSDPRVMTLVMKRLLLASIVEPDLLDPRLLTKAKVQTPEEILEAILRPGEYDLITKAQQRLNREAQLSEDLVEQAKN